MIPDLNIEILLLYFFSLEFQFTLKSHSGTIIRTNRDTPYLCSLYTTGYFQATCVSLGPQKLHYPKSVTKLWDYWVTVFLYRNIPDNVLKDCFFIVFSNYDNPPICEETLQTASASFTCAIYSALRGQRTQPVYADIGLDVWRHVTYRKGIPSEHRGHTLLEKKDMVKLTYLPSNWWYVASDNGDGIQIDFPVKAKPVLSWSPVKGTSGFDCTGCTWSQPKLSTWKDLFKHNKKTYWHWQYLTVY